MDTSPAYFMCKCSICFENDSDTELINCGDQFCLECLERYVEYWIRETSWGIQASRLACPVCGGDLDCDDWMPFVSDRLMTMWRAFEGKRGRLLETFKLTRSCPICHFDQPITGIPLDIPSAVDGIHQVGSQLAVLLDSNLHFSGWRNGFFHLEVALDMMHELSSHSFMQDEEGWLDTVEELWRDFLLLISQVNKGAHWTDALVESFMRFGRLYLRLFHLGAALIHAQAADKSDLIVSRSRLIAAQLDFQLTFPFSRCDSCSTAFCLPCQRSSWHFPPSHPHRPTKKSGASCPRCFVPVEKDAEGCNEINCNFCGFKFCWACKRRWTRECGIYRCLNVSEFEAFEGFEELEELESGIEEGEEEELFHDAVELITEREPEIGVPNIRALEKRFLSK